MVSTIFKSVHPFGMSSRPVRGDMCASIFVAIPVDKISFMIQRPVFPDAPVTRITAREHTSFFEVFAVADALLIYFSTVLLRSRIFSINIVGPVAVLVLLCVFFEDGMTNMHERVLGNFAWT